MKLIPIRRAGLERRLRGTPEQRTRWRTHRTRQLEERLAAGPAWTDLDLIFPSMVGTSMDSTNVTRRFQDRLKEAALPRMTFHELRHGAATMMLAQGASLREIMEVLGHSQIAITANRSTHVAPRLKRAGADRMQAALGS